MPPRPPESPARRALRLMLIRVFGLHVVAIATHELADVGTRPRAERVAFLGVWMALTLAIVGVGLWRVRQARGAARAARRGGPPTIPPVSR